MIRRRLAFGLLIVNVALFLGGIALIPLTAGVDRASGDAAWVGVIFGTANLAFVVSGYMIASRSSNAVGWFLLGLGTLSGLGGAADGYAVYAALKEGVSLPGGVAAAWLADFVISGAGILFGTFIFVFLLFPDGRMLPGRWRAFAWIGGAGSVLAQINVALAPGPLPGFPEIQNPLGSRQLEGILDPAEGVSLLLILIGIFGGLASMVSRFRRSGAEQRQQMKWFGAAAGFLALVILSGPVWWSLPETVSEAAWPILFGVALTFIPVSIAISVLKYRLYDIDVVINRSIVYILLTATLAGCYLGLIVVLQGLLPVSADSDLAIAASTLAVAGLFRPLRGRIQSFIDRRFYRRRYDAAETLAGFSARLRDEIELRSLSAELMSVVTETMQPTHASIWLRSGSRT